MQTILNLSFRWESYPYLCFYGSHACLFSFVYENNVFELNALTFDSIYEYYGFICLYLKGILIKHPKFALANIFTANY